MQAALPPGYGLFVVRGGRLEPAPVVRCERMQQLELLLGRLEAADDEDPEGSWVVAELEDAGKTLAELLGEPDRRADRR